MPSIRNSNKSWDSLRSCKRNESITLEKAPTHGCDKTRQNFLIFRLRVCARVCAARRRLFGRDLQKIPTNSIDYNKNWRHIFTYARKGRSTLSSYTITIDLHIVTKRQDERPP